MSLKNDNEILIATWQNTLHLASLILKSKNQDNESKEIAYKEIMKGAKMLDLINKEQKANATFKVLLDIALDENKEGKD